MAIDYKKIIGKANETGGILDAALALQEAEGYVSGAAMAALADAYGSSEAEIYDSLSFYSMLRFGKEGKTRIEICRGAPCHVAGSDEVIAAIEDYIGCKIGGTSADRNYTFTFTECQGQCQASPAVLINGRLYTGVDPESVVALLEKGD